MEFETPAQQFCYQRISVWMEEFFSDIPWEKLDEPGFGLFMGSAWVEVHIHPWEEDSIINTRSTVVTGAQLNPELLDFLLRQNNNLMFGSFAVDNEGNIVFGHTILGSTCDPEQLETYVIAVLEAADEYDDYIVSRWGGQRALDQSPN